MALDAGPASGRDTVPLSSFENPDAGIDAKPAFPVVGIGASAGGLEAFQRLLAALPGKTGSPAREIP